MILDIRTKRVYQPPDPHDGFRVLVDRIWPRGMAKEQIRADLWLPDVGPSTALRKWFAHDPSKWQEFKKRYFAELDKNPKSVHILLEAAAEGTLTLLFSARDAEHNQAIALKEYLLSKARKRAT
jgi:uncharacterized protein YeaO (DUF488 family)